MTVGGEAVRVDLLDRRREQQVHALGLGQPLRRAPRRAGRPRGPRPGRTGRDSRTARPRPRRTPRAPGASATGGPRGSSPSSGTRPMRRPARRSRAISSRSSATVRTVLMPATSRRRQRARALDELVEERRAARAPSRSTAARCASTVGSSPRATGPGERRARGPSAAKFSTVWRTSGSEQRARVLAARARRRRRSPPRRLQRHEEVRRHRRGGVVGGAALVVDLEGPHARAARRATWRTRAPRAWCPATAAPAPSKPDARVPANVWSGWRPKAGTPACAPERTAGWRRSCVPRAARPRPPSRPRRRSRRRARRARWRRSRRDLAAADGPLDGHTRVAKRARERSADAAGDRLCPPAGGVRGVV